MCCNEPEAFCHRLARHLYLPPFQTRPISQRVHTSVRADYFERAVVCLLASPIHGARQGRCF